MEPESALPWVLVSVVFMRSSQREMGLPPPPVFIYGLPTGAVFGAATGGKNRRGKLIYESN
ncbi:MAG: hypothetical protein WKF71_02415 [Pyrinomonadaceae bacterium]